MFSSLLSRTTGACHFKAFVNIFLSPLAHELQYGKKGFPLFRQRIFHPRRYLRIGFPQDEPVGFQLPELICQGFLRNGTDIRHQFPKAQGAFLRQYVENQWLALAANHFEGDFHFTAHLNFLCHSYLPFPKGKKSA